MADKQRMRRFLIYLAITWVVLVLGMLLIGIPILAWIIQGNWVVAVSLWSLIFTGAVLVWLLFNINSLKRGG